MTATPEPQIVEPGEQCESCGRWEPDLTAVHRVYLDTGSDVDGAATVLDEVEWWCGGCCATYPHVPADDR